MNARTLQMIELALASDDNVSPADRDAILAFCRDPRPLVQVSDNGAAAGTWVSPNEAAQVLSVSLRTVQRLVSSGKLPSRKVAGARRIPASAVYGESAAPPAATDIDTGRLRESTHGGESGAEDRIRMAG